MVQSTGLPFMRFVSLWNNVPMGPDSFDSPEFLVLPPQPWEIVKNLSQVPICQQPLLAFSFQQMSQVEKCYSQAGVA